MINIKGRKPVMYYSDQLKWAKVHTGTDRKRSVMSTIEWPLTDRRACDRLKTAAWEMVTGWDALVLAFPFSVLKAYLIKRLYAEACRIGWADMRITHQVRSGSAKDDPPFSRVRMRVPAQNAQMLFISRGVYPSQLKAALSGGVLGVSIVLPHVSEREALAVMEEWRGTFQAKIWEIQTSLRSLMNELPEIADHVLSHAIQHAVRAGRSFP